MTKFRIMATAGLQESVAHEQGYFRDEGLDYEYVQSWVAEPMQRPIVAAVDRAAPQVMTGAFESMETGRACDVSFACHWAVNMAASADHGRMWGHAYMLTFAGIMVPPESPIRRVEDLRDVEIGVGYHSGSHFSCLQTLEPWIPVRDVKLSFIGLPHERVDLMLDRKIAAANMWGTEKDILEQFGFRKIIDTTYMQGFLLSGDAEAGEVHKYFHALQRAQREIDAAAERYKAWFQRRVPERVRDQVDVRAFTLGQRIVFEPYTREVFERTHRWMEAIQIFPEGQLGHRGYDEAVLV